jgi:hypothetical protein
MADVLTPDASKLIPVVRAAQAVPAPAPQPTSVYSAALSQDQQTQTDTLGQVYRGVAVVRHSPLPASANATANAAANSAAQAIIAKQPASGVTSVGLTVPSFLSVSGSPVTSAGTFAVALAPEPNNTVFAGPSGAQGTAPLDTAASSTGSVPSLTTGTPTVTGATSQSNDFALLAISVDATSGFSSTTNPSGWTVLSPIGTFGNGGGVYWRQVVSAGAFSAAASYLCSGAGASQWVTNLVTLKTSVATPAVRQYTSGALSNGAVGGTNTIAFPGNTLAGSTLFLIAQGYVSTSQFVFGVADSQGNQYTLLDNAYVAYPLGGGEQICIFATPGSMAAACTLTITNTAGGSIPGNTVFYILEVTNLAPPVQTPLFRALVPADIPGMASGILDLAHGGTAANLSATGGSHQFLRQNSVGAAITVVQPAFTDLSGSIGTNQASYQTVEQAGVALTQRPNLNFLPPLVATDDSAHSSTDVTIAVFDCGSL